MDNVDPLDYQEGVVETIEEGFLSLENPSLTNALGQTLVELPSPNPYLDQISFFHQ